MLGLWDAVVVVIFVISLPKIIEAFKKRK